MDTFAPENAPQNASRRHLLKAGWVLPAIMVVAIPTAASAKSDKKPKLDGDGFLGEGEDA